MVALAVVLMIALFLAVDLVLHVRQKPSVAEQLRMRLEASAAGHLPRVAGFRVAPDAAHHPGHTWARRVGDGKARVGLDDFAARLIGRADRIDAPPVGATVQAGHALLTLVRRGRRTAVVAPVSGAVAAINRNALVNPEKVADDPYGDGWLIDIRGADLPQEFRSLLTGEMARRLIDDAAGALHTFLSPVPLQAAADGGQAVDGIADMLDDQTWDRARTRFLLTDPE